MTLQHSIKTKRFNRDLSKIRFMRFKNIVLLLMAVFFFGELGAQDTLEVVDYSARQTYEIGGITVKGAERRDRNAIKSIAGLKVGKKIQIPGPDVPKAIKSLWRLRLFEDVKIVQTKTIGEVVFLEIQLVERPTLSRYSYKGVKKNKHDELNEIIQTIISKGSIVTEDQKALCAQKIKEFFVSKGRLDASVTVDEIEDEVKANSIRLRFNIDIGDKVKIKEIVFEGNEEISDRKLRWKGFKETKRKKALFKKSKFIKEDYEEDKRNVIAMYNKKGFRDAQIVNDSVWRNENGQLMILVELEEGNPYYFRNITWKGNSKYTDEQLTNILGIAKGDVYNSELLENRLRFSFDGRDVSSLYLDDGYLFFDVQPTELSVENDSIDVEMRIFEGPQATIENVTIAGNDRTHEHVIRRILRTRPGKKFSRSDIIRSQREVINLGYFNPEALEINTPVNPQRGTVDIEYKVQEQPSDQLELSAGYGGGSSGLIGTLGVSFNNFSVANIRKRETWSPLPQGDGQKLSLRIQSNSRFFRSYNFSFTEPWLGGKTPTAFTLGGVRSVFDYETFGRGSLKINRLFVGLGKRLKWPDDFFSSNTTMTLEQLKLNNYSQGSFFVVEDNNRILIDRGNFKNFSIKQVFSRSSVNEPIYPRRGSRISLSIQLTPPYSLFKKSDFFVMSDPERIAAIEEENLIRGPLDKLTELEEIALINKLETTRKFEFLEYHKWRFDGEWYFNLFGNVVLFANAKIGMIGAYDGDIGISPFERFLLGGDGLNNQTVSAIAGQDLISLRGYEESEIEQNSLGGATIFDKFTLEMRFPLSLSPTSTIYFSTFVQGGNAWGSFKQFNPFDIKRSAGAGLRVFLPMFGLLGFDYGFGMDRDLGNDVKWTDYGKFSIVLGFEPE